MNSVFRCPGIIEQLSPPILVITRSLYRHITSGAGHNCTAGSDNEKGRYGMYNPHNPHRGMGPANSGNSRLNELLDQVRVEFESQARSSGEYEQQCEFLSITLHVCGSRGDCIDPQYDYAGANRSPYGLSHPLQDSAFFCH